MLLPPRDRAFIGSSILLVSALAWGYLAHLDHQMSSATGSAAGMARMGMATAVPWRAADVLFTFAMWTVMMVAMMSATATPMLLLVAAIHGRRAEHAASMAALPFGLGYLAVWLGFSACATLAQWALHDAALLSPAMATVSPRLAGALLVGAGLFQLTPIKRACLTHCQSPLGFLMSHWRDGAAGAFHIGLRHGIYCLGCCWALMAGLFAVGVMNLVWVGALTVFILLERIGRGGERIARIGGGLLVALGLFVAFT